ncbi:peptidyl-prolyl cis-trans isomerase CWC27-like protein [Hibiscus syriacus]|uniref:RING-type E3 ubiquitin transferase n=1 Tax=Hibiscus syriacus TaxID=106335 RepID=A0A6A2YJ49_HIBSY|nr:peptidyl-prolyl cis-trans isomerase CWC27-like protein [Hibiscus syriacus]
MAPHFLSDENVQGHTTTVAIDKDKNSPHAVRWAVEHLVVSNPFVTLIHVKNKNRRHPLSYIISLIKGDNDSDNDVNQLFITFRGYCARKGIQLKEVVLEDADVCKALLDYVNKNLINNLVVGAATRNSLSRKSKNDIPAILIRSAPEFCSVYVISKGKILTMRTAQRPVSNTAGPPKMSSGMPPHIPSDQLEDDRGRRQVVRGESRNGTDRQSVDNPPKLPMRDRDRVKSSPANLAVPHGSIDLNDQSLDFSMVSATPTGQLPQNTRDIEAEMRRLKLELQQTMDLYSTACKEALTAKRKAEELHQWKMEEARKFEEAKQAGEAALAMAEKEKAKCKAAMEAAEAARKLAEMEAHRRRQAELKAKKEADEKTRALSALAKNDVRYRKYTIEEIEEATENFVASNKIGEGGYGPVFKGKLDHTPVAIKVLRPDAAQGKKQFQQEVEVLCCMRHPNMVLLLGACPEYGCLVYEYMFNGSLEDRLFRKGNTPPLSWRKRFNIAAEIATALLFLHQAKPEPLVHRDLKPANILLDRNYVSKIADVGLARLVPPSVADSVTQYHMTSAAGTFCYIDPEYQQTGMLTTKSDIYSLGIMLLQIITAKPPMGIAHHVGRAIEKGTLIDVLDPAVPNWPLEEALAFARLALKCVELRKKDRPDLGTVIVPELNRLRDFGTSSDSRGRSNNCRSRMPSEDKESSSMTSTSE